FGAEYILVDGATNRLASASPLVTEATILATGAVLGSTMTDVIRKTIFRCAILNTPCVEEEALLSAAQEGLKRGNAAVVHRDGINYQVDPIRARLPLIAGARLKEKYRMESVALILGGALIDSVLKEAMDFFDELPVVVVKDASKIFISPEIYYRYLGRGGKIRVVRRINLVAVTLNPTNPVGKGFNPQLFLKRMTEALSPLPVFDLVLETN
ncbi:MAG TPA: hypothetical protein VLH18_01965, partial [Candidatus Limnocylindrales bacterium]|nr:hypothetical protein [Candidatus Limnocylindrales bacterium]